MKKINSRFIASATDKRRALAHCNAIARQADYDGSVEAWLNKASGEIAYIEHTGSGYCVGGEDMELIAWAYTPTR